MRQHDEQRTIQPRLCETENPQHHKAQMAHRGIRDQLLQVGLNHRDQCAINNANEGERHDPRSVAARLLGKKAQVEAQHPIGAHLEQHSRQQHRTRGGSLHVRVGQPRMKREERNLYGECQEESQEQPWCCGGEAWYRAAHDLFPNHNKIEAAGLSVEPQNRGQHEHGSDHGVHEEFHRGVDLAFMAEDSYEQGHGNQRCFPEEVEEKQVEGSKHSNQSRLQNQQQDKEFLDPLMH